MSAERFRIEDRGDQNEAVLRVVADRLEPTDAAAFQEACARLVKTGRQRLVVDLRGYRAIPSIIIGAVVDLHAEAYPQQVVLSVDAATQAVFHKLFRDLMKLSGGADPEQPPG